MKGAKKPKKPTGGESKNACEAGGDVAVEKTSKIQFYKAHYVAVVKPILDLF